MVWGWCVAGFAYLPYALWVLAAAPLLPAVGWLALCLAGTLAPLVLVDQHFYGAWTVRQGPAARQHARQLPLLTGMHACTRGTHPRRPFSCGPAPQARHLKP